MSQPILETVTFKCPCGATVDYPNTMRGAINVGDAVKATGWYSYHNNYTYGSIWVCPDCAKQAQEHAEEIKRLLGTDRVNVSSIIKSEGKK